MPSPMETLQLRASPPLISVIIPAYNAERFIERTLQSVLGQTYQEIEVLVIDDGSRDRTADIVAQIAEQDTRVTLLRQANSGVAIARNVGIQHAKGEFIAPIDADDIWYPQNLERQVQRMVESDQTVGIVYSWSLEIDENDRLCGGFHSAQYQGDVYLPLLNHNFLGHASAALIRRLCLEELGGYDAQLLAQNAQGCEDWDLYLRIAQRYQFRVVPEFLIGYRQVRNSMSQNFVAMVKSQELILAAAQQRYPLPNTAIYRWAKSLFFLYLAQRSSQSTNFSVTLDWLKRAFLLDPVMVVLHHDLYIILLTLVLTPLRQSVRSRDPLPQMPSKSPSQDTLRRTIHLKTKIRERLPITLYNKARLKRLAASLQQFCAAPQEPLAAIASPSGGALRRHDAGL